MIHHGEIPDGMIICHKCDNPPCCNPLHLYAGSHSDNANDRTERNRGRSKLKKQQVAEIKNIFKKESTLTTKQIAERYNVSASTIYFIKSQRTWMHITC